MKLVGHLTKMPNPRQPLTKLILGIKIAKTLGNGDATLLLGLTISPVKPDDRNVSGGFSNRRQAGPKPLRFIDAHQGQIVMSQQIYGAGEEFNDWYDRTHLPDVLKTPGFVHTTHHINTDPNSGPDKFLALYDIEIQNIEETMTTLR